MLTAVGSEPLVLGPQLRHVPLELRLRAARQLVELRALQHLQQHGRHQDGGTAHSQQHSRLHQHTPPPGPPVPRHTAVSSGLGGSLGVLWWFSGGSLR